MGGALPEAELLELIERTGFVRAAITHRFDCVEGTSREDIARWFGVCGVNVLAVKPPGR